MITERYYHLCVYIAYPSHVAWYTHLSIWWLAQATTYCKSEHDRQYLTQIQKATRQLQLVESTFVEKRSKKRLLDKDMHGREGNK